MQEGSVGNLNGCRVNDLAVTDWQSVKCEEQLQELNEQQSSLAFMDTYQVSTCDFDQLTEVKQEKKADCGEYGRSRDETRHWIVGEDGLLKEIKAEQTIGVSVVMTRDIGLWARMAY